MTTEAKLVHALNEKGRYLTGTRVTVDASVTNKDKKIFSYPPDRICSACESTLSVYNGGPLCFRCEAKQKKGSKQWN